MDPFERLAEVTDAVSEAVDAGVPSAGLRRELDLAFAVALDDLSDDEDAFYRLSLVHCYERLMTRLDEYEQLAA